MELINVSAEQFGLSEIQATAIANKFLPIIEEMQPLVEKYNEIKILEQENPDNSKQFDDLRKKFVKVRTNCAKIHKEEKAYYLAGGKYVDSWKNKQLEVSEPIEADLKEKADYFEIQEQKRKDALKTERIEELSLYGVDGSYMGLGDMDDKTWDFVLSGTKTQYANKIAEEERIKKEIEEKAEQDRIAAEEQRKKDIAEAEAKAEQRARERFEFEASEKIRLAELAQKQAEEKAEADIQKAKDEAERAIKAAADKAEAERKEAERQSEIKAENERKAEAEKQRLALLAPDKEKAEKYVADLRTIKFPEFTTNEYLQRKPKFGQIMAMAIKELLGE